MQPCHEAKIVYFSSHRKLSRCLDIMLRASFERCYKGNGSRPGRHCTAGQHGKAIPRGEAPYFRVCVRESRLGSQWCGLLGGLWPWLEAPGQGGYHIAGHSTHNCKCVRVQCCLMTPLSHKPALFFMHWIACPFWNGCNKIHALLLAQNLDCCPHHSWLGLI